MPITIAFQKLADVVKTLRNPVAGCPWDLKQNHDSLCPYVIEEAYEVIEAVHSNNDNSLCEELGDLLLQIILHAQLASERNAFDINDVVKSVTEKMVRRHPHVFGQVTVNDVGDVLKNWEALKLEERKNKKTENDADVATAALNDIPQTLPSLLKAQRIGEKVARVNFDWKSTSEVWKKVEEELEELKTEIESQTTTSNTAQTLGCLSTNKKLHAIEHELGDLLFSICQLARWLGLNAEMTLQKCCRRFLQRFSKMSSLTNKPLKEIDSQDLDKLWQAAKQLTKQD